MIYYVFKNQIFTVFLSLNHLTAITFPGKVHDYVGGQEGEFKVYELNKKRSLIFDPTKKSFNRNFIVFKKDEKFHFNLKYDETLSNKDIVLMKAKKCSLYSSLKETKLFKLFECPKSLYIVNKSQKGLKVNDLEVKNHHYISKGPPVWVNGELVYHKGRVL